MSKIIKSAVAIGLSSVILLGGATAAQAATVPNRFERTCSYWTSHCTGYTQVNGRHVAGVPDVYITNWTWAFF